MLLKLSLVPKKNMFSAKHINIKTEKNAKK